MATRHVRRFVPPWCGESQNAFCATRITDDTVLVGIPELEALSEEHLKVPLRRVAAWVGDATLKRVCSVIDVCQRCLRAYKELRSWDEDPLLCMAQHAAFVAGRRVIDDRIELLAELMTIAHLIEANQDTYAATLLREKALLVIRRSQL